MTRAEAQISLAKLKQYMSGGGVVDRKANEAIDMAIKALEEPQWIPVKMIPMGEEERAYWSEHIGYDVEYEGAVKFDCKMPDDGQEIWVQTKNGGVYEDVCEDDGGWFGLEGNGDWLDIVAWMPKYIPEPWEGKEK